MGKGVNCESKEEGWIPTKHRHKHPTKMKKKTFGSTENVQIRQFGTLDGIKINGQKMTTPRTLNGNDYEDDSIEVVKKEQQFSSSLVTSMLLASIKELASEKYKSDTDLTIDHMPCAVYERVQYLLSFSACFLLFFILQTFFFHCIFSAQYSEGTVCYLQVFLNMNLIFCFHIYIYI